MDARWSSTGQVISIDALRHCASQVLRRLDHPDEHAAVVADVLVDADLRGYDDHGVALLSLLPPLLRAGRHNPRPTIRVVSETASALLLDGDRGFGVMPGFQAMRWCVAQAKARRGIACAGVRNAGYAISLAPYVEEAARAGCIAFTGVNAVPMVAPPGGTTRTLGTNPLAYGVPAGRHEPIVLDMATSVVSGGKALAAQLQGKLLPEGLVADAAGQTTTDPSVVDPRGTVSGSVLPLGWPHSPFKGFGLAMLMDVLAGVLTGGAFGLTANTWASNVGQFCWALDVRAFLPLEEFQTRIDAQIDQVKASAKQAGVQEIVVPGERSQRRRAEALARGTVALPPEAWQQFVAACSAVEVALPNECQEVN